MKEKSAKRWLRRNAYRLLQNDTINNQDKKQLNKCLKVFKKIKKDIIKSIDFHPFLNNKLITNLKLPTV